MLVDVDLGTHGFVSYLLITFLLNIVGIFVFANYFTIIKDVYDKTKRVSLDTKMLVFLMSIAMLAVGIVFLIDILYILSK